MSIKPLELKQNYRYRW